MQTEDELLDSMCEQALAKEQIASALQKGHTHL